MRIVDTLIGVVAFCQEATGFYDPLTLSIRQRWILRNSSWTHRRLLMRVWRSKTRRIMMGYRYGWRTAVAATGLIADAATACQKEGVNPELIDLFGGRGLFSRKVAT